MGFLSSITSSLVKTVISPVAVVKDVVNIAVGEEPSATKELFESAGEDVKEAFDDLSDGEIL